MPTQRLPIIGFPLASTPLEAVLRAAFEATSAGLAVEHWERKAHLLADALAEVKGRTFAGALIASPHKEKAAALAGALSEDARAGGAVNLIVRDGTKLRGHNTDVDAVRVGLTSILPRVQGKWPRQAVVLGAGGGARAVVAVLIGAGFQHVSVFNRHLHRAEALVGHFARGARHMELRARPWHEAIIEAELAKAPLLVNASGIGGQDGTTPIPAELIPPDRYVLDLVLHQATTPLMAAAQSQGGTVANGQAAFLAGCGVIHRLLTGTDAPQDVMRAALADHLGLPEERIAVVGD